HTRFSRHWSADVCSSDLPWERLLRVPRQALDLVRPLTDLRAAYLPASGLALLRLGLTLLLLRRYDLLGDLLTGARTRTRDANERSEERRVGKEWKTRRSP